MPTTAPMATPGTADPDTVLAILRSDDDGPDALYPCQIGVFCDGCGTIVKRDILVNDALGKAERLEAARSHLRGDGWQCDADGDWCPSCLADDEDEEETAPCGPLAARHVAEALAADGHHSHLYAYGQDHCVNGICPDPLLDMVMA